MNSELKARFANLGPVRDAAPDPSFSGETEAVLLRRIGPFDQRVNVAKRLRLSGLSLRAAHGTITLLAAQDWALCDIPVNGGIGQLANDLLALDVRLERRRHIADPATFLANMRARHDLSQREFAAALGLDARTLQNWEQGRNRPDAAALNLATLFDRDPAAVRDALFEPVEPSQPAAAAAE